MTDTDAYGCIVVHDAGALAVLRHRGAALISCGELGQDEFFVYENAARAGVRVTNRSATGGLVILHFGSNNEQLPRHL